MSPPGEQPRGGVLAANIDLPLAGRVASKTTRTWPLLLGALLALAAMASFTLFGSRAPSGPVTSMIVFEGQDIGGSTIVRDCFAVDADPLCLTANPSLHRALEKLATTSEGPALLRGAARAGVVLRVGALTGSSDAAFDPKNRSVTVNTSTVEMSARGQAAVLANMLRFVSTWAGPAGILPHTGLTCIQEEASALATEMAVWRELRAEGAPSDRLETAEEKLVTALDGRGLGFWVDQAMQARGRCGG